MYMAPEYNRELGRRVVSGRLVVQIEGVEFPSILAYLHTTSDCTLSANQLVGGDMSAVVNCSPSLDWHPSIGRAAQINPVGSKSEGAAPELLPSTCLLSAGDTPRALSPVEWPVSVETPHVSHIPTTMRRRPGLEPDQRIRKKMVVHIADARKKSKEK